MSPDRLDALGPEALARVDALIDRANHDVAKYMAMTARNVEPTAMSDDEVDYLLADLRQTDGERAAWELWAEISMELAALLAHPAVESIDREMSRLETLTSRCADGDDELETLVTVAIEIADNIAGLRRAVRRRMMEVQG